MRLQAINQGGIVHNVGLRGVAISGDMQPGRSFTLDVGSLAAGTYQFDMTGSNDADLYVRIGKAPTTATYDCRPYKNGSNESCTVTLAQPSKIDVMVRGYATTSDWALVGKSN